MYFLECLLGTGGPSRATGNTTPDDWEWCESCGVSDGARALKGHCDMGEGKPRKGSGIV